MDQEPFVDGTGLTEAPEIVDLSDGPIDRSALTSTAPRAPKRRRRIARRGVSVPAAVGGALLVAAIAFGAAGHLAGGSPSGDGAATGGGRTTTADGGGATGAGDGEVDGQLAGEHGDDGGDGVAPGTDLGSEPGSNETTEPTDPPATEPRTIDIALHLGDGRVTVEWGACEVDGFVAWKVIRSADGDPSWPLGDGDHLVLTSEDQGLHTGVLGDVTPGSKIYVRVVGLVERDGELVVACRSRAADIRIPSETPTTEPTPEPKPDPTPEPKPEIGSIGLTVTLTDAGKPRVDWTECVGDWDYTKVVRSTNDGVSYPLGSGDSFAGMFGKDGPTAMTDGDAGAGKTYWYRVFCLHKTGDGYTVVAVSPSRKVTTPAAEPLPEPDPVGLDVAIHVTDGGAVALEWGTCSDEHFVAYKVVRSANPNPSYLPGTDGSVVVAVKESASATSFVDTSVEPGQTWFYRVQCIGWMNDHKILLGQTDVVSVTLPS